MNSRGPQTINARFLFKPEMVRIPAWKRGIDVALCIVALPLLCLVAAVMCVIVKLASPGPVLFRQERVGYKGSRFMCYKFRTMVVNADSRSHQVYYDSLLSSRTSMVKLDAKGDSRLIPGAWLLRATGLDELPQIINVFRREMCIVGPRPCLPYEFEKYEAWQRERFNSVPGLTGLWQVSGKNRTSFEEMIRLDIRYSEARSLSLDLRIILMTVPALAVQVADTRSARKSLADSIAVRTAAPTVACKPTCERKLHSFAT
jgi:lipopolysaccharide/colanic/teichoic acid biosynthesis glycosyltransferase